MFLSVALATFNGARFLPEQLRSLDAQARLPDELIVADDASSDETPAIVERFAAAASFPVRLERNPRNLGTAANFGRAIGLCRGDVIALADQDDVWHANKLERIERAFLEAGSVGMVFSDARLVDSDRHPKGRTLWKSLGFSRSERRRFENGKGFACLLRRDRVTGATMAFRAGHRDLVLPIPEGWLHDAWIALLISAVAPCRPIAEPLIDYRQHEAQQIGGGRPSLLAQARRARQMNQAAFESLVGHTVQARDRLAGYPGVPAEYHRLIEAKIVHLRYRLRLRQRRGTRWPAVIRELWRGDYFRYSPGWKAVAQDLYLG